MIINKGQSDVEQKILSESRANPVVQVVCAVAEAFPAQFVVEAAAGGLELRASGHLESGLPNRARMRVFSPKAGHTLVFFFKKSLVPYSRDRYSYGGIELRTPHARDADVAAWLEFVGSGFHPDRRPADPRRAFPFEIPE